MLISLTALTIIWLNSARRNGQKSVTLINQVQIRQWYLMSHYDWGSNTDARSFNRS